MRRVYFLVPSVVTARAIVDELLLKRIEVHCIHVIVRKDTPHENLPAARLAQSSDIVTALQRGAAAGGLTGLLAGLAAAAFPPAGLVLGGGAALGMTLFGAWMSGMVGVGMPDIHVEQYQAAIESGELLMMNDVPRDRAQEIESMVTGHHPEVELEGVDLNIPIFP